jgi:fructose/tagatose bisphosphate aldolase
MYATLSELTDSLQYTLTHSPEGVSIIDATALKDKAIDMLVMSAFFSGNEAVRIQSRNIIREAAGASGIFSSSILPLYQAIGQGKVSGFTVPAMNVRTLTYDFARVVFRLAMQHQVGPFVFEIARSEMEYTEQTHDDFAIAILAGAIKENYKGPVFLQGDHYQIRKKHFVEHYDEEIEDIKKLIDGALQAQFYNIDIDASTLVDLTQGDLKRQQELNSDITAVFTTYIRNKQPRNINVSIGGEIGHIGDRNSTPEDFQAFMDQYLPQISGQQGISKVSVQTGTSHGGTVLPDGSMQEVKLDFGVLEAIGNTARERYGMGGAVQHGASTLPENLFSEFPKVKTLEIHLSTGFQNTVFDHLPEGLKTEMLDWVNENCKSDMKPDWNEQQFLYKARKKALGPFKRQLWEMREEEKQPIIAALEVQLTTLFTTLNVFGTRDTVTKYFTYEDRK